MDKSVSFKLPMQVVIINLYIVSSRKESWKNIDTDAEVIFHKNGARQVNQILLLNSYDSPHKLQFYGRYVFKPNFFIKT